MVSGIIDIESMWRALGEEKASALATYVPCIHWNGQCWEILRNKQNKMISAIHKT